VRVRDAAPADGAGLAQRGRPRPTASHHLRILEDDRPVCLVTVLVVASGMRRRGVGSLLMDAVERQARAAGCGRLVVGTACHRARAHAFYRKRGFAETGLRFQKRLG
jgi:GNAT superfamily N-acetyltransferase